MMRIHEVVNVEEAPLDIFKRGAAAAKAFMQKPQASAPATPANQVQPASQLKNGTKDSGYTYNAQTRKWVHPTKGIARGMLNRQLMNKYGANDSGEPLPQSLGQKISQKLGGPFAQGLDPKAGIAQKIGAKIGSALGRGVAALVRPKDADGDGQPDAADAAPEQPAASQQPAAQAPQAPANRFSGGGVKVPDGADSFEVTKNQMRNLKVAPGAKPLPAKMVASLQADMKKLAAGDKDSGVFAADKILKFAQAGYDVSKLHPQWLATAKAGERFLTQGAYNEITNMLESFGLTWNDLGLVVRIDESDSDYVFIMSRELADLKIKAGI
jgi:hypothetical protein